MMSEEMGAQAVAQAPAEEAQAAQAPAVEMQTASQAAASSTSYDVNLDSQVIEWEVETEPAAAPVYREDYDSGYDSRQEDIGYQQGQGDRVARAYNKHLFTWVFSYLLGLFGVDRFLRGQYLLGTIKLLTWGGFGIWYLADLIIAAMKSYAGGYRQIDELLFDEYGNYIY